MWTMTTGSIDHIVNQVHHARIFTGGLWGEMRVNYKDGSYITRFPLNKYFMDWLHPTEDERILFEIEIGLVYPSQVLLDQVPPESDYPKKLGDKK